MKNSHKTKSTQRFCQPSEFYHKNRPGYPDALFDFLLAKNIIGPNKVIADIGSGTGIFSQYLLDRGTIVYAVEPNVAMRNIAKAHIQDPNFTSIAATAENTKLANDYVDAITAATAFHWFDRAACTTEFKRILKPDGWILLAWNLRDPQSSPLSHDYEELLLKYCKDYTGIPNQHTTEQEILSFFRSNSATIHNFDNQQQLDLEGLIGRVRSTSYAPTPEQAGFAAMTADLEQLFAIHQVENKITLPYNTKVYLGKL